MATKHTIKIPAGFRQDIHVVEATVTNNVAAISEWISRVRNDYGYQTVVGLGCQWKPNRIDINSTKNNKIATLQLCVETKCLIVQMFHLGNIPLSLMEFLSDADYTFVGVGVEDNVVKLLDEYGLSVTCRADLQTLAVEKNGNYMYAFRNFRSTVLELLKRPALSFLTITIERPLHIYRSNWETRNLCAEQIKYACSDAFASFKVGHRLLKEV